MAISDIEQQLREAGGNITVVETDDIPFSDYHEFLNLEKAGKVRIASAYDGDLVNEFGGKAAIIMHYLLVWSPVLFAMASVAFSFILSNYWLLVGVPLAILGFLLSTPAFMKGIGSFIALGTLIYFVYSCYAGKYANAVIAGSYALSNFFVYVAREQCRMIIHETIIQSEPIFVWLYKNGRILIKREE
ncbi:MAG: hypothetical protein H8D67_14275 [Deltaproteobacteria bacterium]|nr:hypothetical protein [Deltaproteobacteria bacterium]